MRILPDTVDIKSQITPEVRYRGIYEAILKNRVVTLMVGGILVILYTYLYILLQLEDYALLMGSIGLFVVLSVIMYLTRKIDWYASSQERPARLWQDL